MRGLALALSLLLVTPGAVAAQQQQQTPNADQTAADLARLHAALHLNSGQEAAWRDYTAAIAPNPQTDARRRAAEEMMPTLPTPRRIALMESTLAADAADLRREGAAVTAFYSQLTPAQQQIFDRETAPPSARRGTSP